MAQSFDARDPHHDDARDDHDVRGGHDDARGRVRTPAAAQALGTLEAPEVAGIPRSPAAAETAVGTPGAAGILEGTETVAVATVGVAAVRGDPAVQVRDDHERQVAVGAETMSRQAASPADRPARER